jgi:SEC-C motif-containing protein
MQLINCPCGKASYMKCCGRFLEQGAIAHTAEEVMRSRYSAYVLHHDQYLLNTWHSTTRPATLNTREEPVTKWVGLSVKHANTDGDNAIVEFVASYRVPGGGPAERLHERSRFVRENGQWFYVDGQVQAHGKKL